MWYLCRLWRITSCSVPRPCPPKAGNLGSLNVCSPDVSRVPQVPSHMGSRARPQTCFQKASSLILGPALLPLLPTVFTRASFCWQVGCAPSEHHHGDQPGDLAFPSDPYFMYLNSFPLLLQASSQRTPSSALLQNPFLHWLLSAPRHPPRTGSSYFILCLSTLYHSVPRNLHGIHSSQRK